MGSSPTAGMANVLSPEKRQVIALGRLGWSLRRIEEGTGVRRETARTYLQRRVCRSGRRGGRADVRRGDPVVHCLLRMPTAGAGSGAGWGSIRRKLNRKREKSQTQASALATTGFRGYTRRSLLPLEQASNLQVPRSSRGGRAEKSGS